MKYEDCKLGMLVARYDHQRSMVYRITELNGTFKLLQLGHTQKHQWEIHDEFADEFTDNPDIYQKATAAQCRNAGIAP
jgi:hypothetical protein